MRYPRAATSVLALVCIASPHAAAHAGIPFDERITNRTSIDLTVSNYGHFGNNFRSLASSMCRSRCRRVR